MKNIHVLPTDKPSRLFEIIQFNLSFDKTNYFSEDYKIIHKYKNKHIYITNDEEIKVGDWFAVELFKITGELRGLHIEKCIKLNDIWCNDFDVVSTRHKGNCNKIILTDNKDLIKDGVQAIDDEFLEWFVKNPSCEFVEVVDDWNSPRIDAYEYKIIIPKEEPKQEHSKYLSCCKSLEKCYCYKKPKQETLEEAIDRISKENGYDIEGGKVADFVDGMVKGAKWQQERMYSEEDMVNYALFILNNNVITVKEWFEKFKKK